MTIESLYHVTHQREFDQIFEPGHNQFCLRSHEKKGKHGYNVSDGSPLGDSYSALHNDDPPTEDSQYRYHSPDVSLLPGSYIWWSVGIEPQHKIFAYNNFWASEIFPNGQSSIYGSKKIYGDFKDVLVAYQECFGKNLPPPIELRIGGTLRYKREVCHIVIVNAAIPDHDDVRNDYNYPIWSDAEGVQVGIYYNDDNKVFHAEVRFIVKNGLIGQGCSWDHVVFAFYFPENGSEMVCRKPPFDNTEVPHSREWCRRSRWDRGQKLCPDDDGYYWA